jgi:hypothetical protein
MRLGCLGCLVVGVALAAVGIAAAGVVFLSANIFAEPDDVQVVPFTKADGYRAQQKLYEILLRQGRRSARVDPIVLSERELNAFLASHLEETAGLPLSPLTVTLHPDNVLELRGRTMLKHLMQGVPFPQLLPYLPGDRAEQPVWVRVRGRVRVERDRLRPTTSYGQLEVTEFALGTQPIGAWVLKLILGQTGRALLRWQTPRVVEDIATDDGRLIVRTTAP